MSDPRATPPLVFDHVTLGQRVLFGSGRAGENLRAEVLRRGAERVMVIAGGADRAIADAVVADLAAPIWFDQVAQHVPAGNAVAARAVAAERAVDLLVSIGGGSTTGLAKAVALTSGLPIIAVPTTYAGSEATNVWGITQDQTKTTGVDDRVLPAVVVYDAELTLSLPVDLSVASGVNGLAHCVDSLWAPRADPINQALALEGARALSQALRGIVADPRALAPRELALHGCYLAAVAFSSAGSGLHHKICHVLGGSFGLPHAQTHAAVLPHVLALNAPALPELARRLAAALGSREPPDDEPEPHAVAALCELYEDVEAPTRLADHGLAESDLPAAVERVLVSAPAANPTALTAANLTSLLTGALTGASPAVGPGRPGAALTRRSS